MNASYVIAVAATRVLGLITVLILFHMMPSDEFGALALMNTNAMSIYMVFGGWLTAIGNRGLVSDGDIVDQALFSSIAFAQLGMMAIVGLLGIVVQFLVPTGSSHIAVTAGLTIVLICYEATLAATNALGRAEAYAVIAVSRHVIALFLSAGLVALGTGASGAALGMGAGAILAILLQPVSRRLWRDVRYRPDTFSPLRPFILFGIGGALQLGCYILINAPLRNLIALKFSTATAGLWSISTDLYYAPVALLANSYSLSQVRFIYLAAAQNDDEALKARCQELLDFGIVLAALYGAAAAFFAVSAGELVFPGPRSADMAALAVPAAMLGVAIVVLYCLVTILLVHGRVPSVAWLIATIAIAPTLPAMWSADVTAACWQATFLVNALTLVWMTYTVKRCGLSMSGSQIARIGLTVAAFVAAAMAAIHVLTFPFAWILSAVLATAVFAAAAMFFRVEGFLNALPKAWKRRWLASWTAK